MNETRPVREKNEEESQSNATDYCIDINADFLEFHILTAKPRMKKKYMEYIGTERKGRRMLNN